MRVFRAAVMAVVLAGLIGPVFAQDSHVPRYGEEDKDKGYGQIQDEKAAAQAYKRSLGNIPDQAAPDPWGSARSVNTAPSGTANKASAKPAKTAKPTRTGNNTN